MLLQVFNGMSMEVLEEQEKWCRVRLADGYEGWVHRPFLTSSPPPPPTHIVRPLGSHVQSAAGANGDLSTRLPGGTMIHVEETDKGWMLAKLAGSDLPRGWIPSTFLHGLKGLPVDPDR